MFLPWVAVKFNNDVITRELKSDGAKNDKSLDWILNSPMAGTCFSGEGQTEDRKLVA